MKEFNLLVKERLEAKENNSISLAWSIVNFVGLLFSGKLKPLKEYLTKDKRKAMPKSLREKNIEKAKEMAKSLGHNY